MLHFLHLLLDEYLLNFNPVYNKEIMAQNISVPDIGDFKDVEVIEILVKPGDQIKRMIRSSL